MTQVTSEALQKVGKSVFWGLGCGLDWVPVLSATHSADKAAHAACGVL